MEYPQVQIGPQPYSHAGFGSKQGLIHGFLRAPLPPAPAEVDCLLEELRVSLFAQSLGTAQPVSAKRVRTAINSL